MIGRDCEAGEGSGFLGSAQLARLTTLLTHSTLSLLPDDQRAALPTSPSKRKWNIPDRTSRIRPRPISVLSPSLLSPPLRPLPSRPQPHPPTSPYLLSPPLFLSPSSSPPQSHPSPSPHFISPIPTLSLSLLSYKPPPLPLSLTRPPPQHPHLIPPKTQNAHVPLFNPCKPLPPRVGSWDLA